MKKWKTMIIAQGCTEENAEKMCGDDPFSVLKPANHLTPIISEYDGYLGDIDAMKLALVASRQGAGREKATDHIDFNVGLDIKFKVSHYVKKGDTLVVFHHNKPLEDQDKQDVLDSFAFVSEQPLPPKLILGTIGC